MEHYESPAVIATYEVEKLRAEAAAVACSSHDDGGDGWNQGWNNYP
jgi:hypothetical protein